MIISPTEIHHRVDAGRIDTQRVFRRGVRQAGRRRRIVRLVLRGDAASPRPGLIPAATAARFGFERMSSRSRVTVLRRGNALDGDILNDRRHHAALADPIGGLRSSTRAASIRRTCSVAAPFSGRMARSLPAPSNAFRLARKRQPAKAFPDRGAERRCRWIRRGRKASAIIRRSYSFQSNLASVAASCAFGAADVSQQAPDALAQGITRGRLRDYFGRPPAFRGRYRRPLAQPPRFGPAFFFGQLRASARLRVRAPVR